MAFRQRFANWWRNAFAIPAASEFAPTEGERQVAERVCQLIADRGLIAPALVFLESSRPLNFVAAQSLYFFTPFISALSDTKAWEEFARLLERPGSVEYLCQLLEAHAHCGHSSEGQKP